MERLEFDFPGSGNAPPENAHALAGVLGSGNLEVLIEPTSLGGACKVVVETSVTGFGPTWEKVLEAFFERHPLTDVTVSINDAGATPAVVSLRLEQALSKLREDTG